MDATNELRLKVLDAWRGLPPERRQTEEHAVAFAREFVARGLPVIGREQVLAWLKEDLRVSRAVGS